MRQEFWRARAFPMISPLWTLPLPHPRTGGSLPTLRFRFFEKRRATAMPQPADGAPGRPLPKFDLDTKRAFPLTPEDPTLGQFRFGENTSPAAAPPAAWGANCSKFQVELVKFLVYLSLLRVSRS